MPIEVSKVYKTLGTAYLATMFFWMMYRAKQDGLVLLVRSRLSRARASVVLRGDSSRQRVPYATQDDTPHGPIFKA